MMTARPAPITAGEGLALLSRVLSASGRLTVGPVLLAVSGGPDSMAMLSLAAQNRTELRRIGVEFHVATVDHRLRPGSAAEAEGVACACRALELPHRILAWDGPKPVSNLQGEARRARYALLEASASTLGATAILTAHHQDDQIESHELARDRQAGDRGLAGMRMRRALAPGLDLIRPFLCMPGARLRATAAISGLAVFDDPSNENETYARVRVRKALSRWSEAKRVQRLAAIAEHRSAVERADRAIAVAMRRGGAIDDKFGQVRIEHEGLNALPADLRADLLGRMIVAVAGAEHPPMRDALDRLSEEMLGAGRHVSTLGGTRLEFGDGLMVSREYGREGPSALSLKAARSGALFDGRFLVSLETDGGAADAALSEALLVPFGRLGRGNPAERVMPVLVSASGALLAIPAVLSRKALETSGRLCIVSRVPWRLWADLPRDETA